MHGSSNKHIFTACTLAEYPQHPIQVSIQSQQFHDEDSLSIFAQNTLLLESWNCEKGWWCGLGSLGSTKSRRLFAPTVPSPVHSRLVVNSSVSVGEPALGWGAQLFYSREEAVKPLRVQVRLVQIIIQYLILYLIHFSPALNHTSHILSATGVFSAL